jgi:hypothetical protein
VPCHNVAVDRRLNTREFRRLGTLTTTRTPTNAMQAAEDRRKRLKLMTSQQSGGCVETADAQSAAPSTWAFVSGQYWTTGLHYKFWTEPLHDHGLQAHLQTLWLSALLQSLQGVRPSTSIGQCCDCSAGTLHCISIIQGSEYFDWLAAIPWLRSRPVLLQHGQ